MGGAAHDLARAVAVVVNHEPAAVTVKNMSSLSPADAADIRRVFEAEFKPAGSPAATVEITISENLADFVLSAEVRRSGERQVLLESWPRTAAPRAARVTLQANLLWEQDRPILDAVRSGDRTLVLDGSGVWLLQGTARQSAAIPGAHVWPRDLRGHLSLSLPAFTAWLPGVICRGAVEPQLSVECHDSQDPWLLGPGVLASFDSARNFFTGRIFASPGGAHDIPPFYSAALLGDAWLTAGVDGRARVYSPAWDQTAAIDAWDGDAAGLQTPCGPRLVVAQSESVQPFELRNGAAAAAGPAVGVTGRIAALWSAGSSATVVSHDLETGRYAAYSLAPACGS